MPAAPDLSPVFARPRLVLSRCLELDACRYNGAAIRAPVVRRLEPHVELIPICPEVEIGLGVPRDPIRLVRGGDAGPAGGAALVQPASGRDLTASMRSFSARFLAGLPEVEGFLLKARSPSCGIHGVKVFGDATSDEPRARESGMFATAVRAAYPEHPTEHEARLGNPRLLDEFLTRVFALADLREARERDGRPEALRTLHERYELTLQAHGGNEETRSLGRIASRAASGEDEAWQRYAAGFRRLLARPPRTCAHALALARMMDELEAGAMDEERAGVRELLQRYRTSGAPRAPLLGALRGWAARMGSTRFQGYLNPYPPALGDPDGGE